MMTLRQFSSKPETIPIATSWYLADLGEARGRQEFFTKQSPQRLRVLREHALIESAISSNRIEGVVVDQARIETLIFGKPKLRDRNEEEVRGYRNALKRNHEQGPRLPVTKSPRGAKTDLIEAAIGAFPGEFTLADLERACPGASRDMARRVLRDLQKTDKVECLGRGPGARWGNISNKR
jgi:hypothetical protein